MADKEKAAALTPAEAQAVKAALASGLWKEKVDPRTNRKYYKNVKTNEATWNLAKELRKSGALTAARENEATETLSRQERHERMRQRAEAEVQLASTIAQLEQEKVLLEMEVTRLRGPVEAEVAELNQLKRQVADRKFSIDAVHREATVRRNARHAELQAIMVNLTNLQSVVDNDAAFKESVETKHRQLLVESMELSADLERERSAAESLKTAVREAERSLEVATTELKSLQGEMTRREELVRIAEEDLEAISRRRAEAEAIIKSAKAKQLQVQERTAKASRINAKAQEVAQSGTAASIKKLTEQYQAKVRMLETLSKLEEQVDDVMMLEHSNQKLRSVIHSAQADAQALDKLAVMLEAELKRVTDYVIVARNDCTAVARSIAEVEKNIADHLAMAATSDVTAGSTLGGGGGGGNASTALTPRRRSTAA